MHGLSYVGRRLNALQFNAHDFDAPLLGCLIQNGAQLIVYVLAARQRLVQCELAYNVTQIGLSKLCGGKIEVGYVVDQPHGISCAIVDDGVHGNGNIVFRDDFHWRHVDNVFTHVHFGHAIDKRNNPVEAGFGSTPVFAQTFYDAFLERTHQANAQREQHHDDHNRYDYEYAHGLAFLPCGGLALSRLHPIPLVKPARNAK